MRGLLPIGRAPADLHRPGPPPALGLLRDSISLRRYWSRFGLGVAIMVVAIIRWVVQVRQEMDDLPLEH